MWKVWENMSAGILKPSAFGQLLGCVISKDQLLCPFSVGLTLACISVGEHGQIKKNNQPLASQPHLLLVCSVALDSSAPSGLLHPQRWIYNLHCAPGCSARYFLKQVGHNADGECLRRRRSSPFSFLGLLLLSLNTYI